MHTLVAVFAILTLLLVGRGEADARKPRPGAVSAGPGAVSAGIAATAAAAAFAHVSSDTAAIRAFLFLDNDFLRIHTHSGDDFVLPRSDLQGIDRDTFVDSLRRTVNGSSSDDLTTSIYIDSEQYNDLKSLIAGRSDDVPVFVVSSDRALRLRSLASPEGNMTFFEFSDNMLLPDSVVHDVARIERILAQKFDPKDVHLISFFDEIADEETVRALKAVGSDAAGFNVINTHKALDEIFANTNSKVVIMVGHIEGEHINILDTASRTKATYPVTELVDAAQRRGSVPVVLGCESALIRGVGGHVCPINSLDVARSIERAMTSSTYKELYENISGNSMFVVENAHVSDISLVISGRVVDHTLAKAGTRLTVFGAAQLSATSRVISWAFRVPVLGPVIILLLTLGVPSKWTFAVVHWVRWAFRVPPLSWIDWIVPVWLISSPIVYPLLGLAYLQKAVQTWLHRLIGRIAGGGFSRA